MSKNCWNEGKFYGKELEKELSKYEYIPNPSYHKKNDCCCEKDFEKLFNLLLCNDNFRELLDDNASFGFMGKELFIGAVPNKLDGKTGNIQKLEVKSLSYDPCNCGFLTLPNRAKVYYPFSTADLTYGEIRSNYLISRISLCTLNAFGIQFSGTDADEAFEDFVEALECCIDKDDCPCEGKKCHPVKCPDCCCNESILSQIDCLFGNISLTAGWLTLFDYKFLTHFGNIGIFYNPDTNFIYFICLNSIFGF